MNVKRIFLGSLVVGMLMLSAGCALEPGEETTGPEEGVTTEPENSNDNYQGHDPTAGEPNEGHAEGSKDESLEGLGGGYEWRREGGIAGFCDVVTVLAGTATVASCAADPPEIVGEVTLTDEQSRQMMTWLEELRTFDDTRRDPATTDAMTVTIIFAGQGDNEPTDEIIAELDALATDILRAVAEQN